MALFVVRAKYANEYKVQIFFSDKTSRTVDFSVFLNAHDHPTFNKYKRLSNFKKFKIENGNITWGKDWDLIFPVEQLHKGKIVS